MFDCFAGAAVELAYLSRHPNGTTVPYVPPRCEDFEESCSYWLDLGYCQDDSPYYSYMKDVCQRTCRFCKSASTTSTATSTKRTRSNGPRKHTTAAPTTSTTRTIFTFNIATTAASTSSTSACEDLNVGCWFYNTARRYCRPASVYHDWMAVNCRKSCGYC